MLISVCLCTYRRPSVTETLDSIAAQVLPPGWSLELVVVDNDPAGSAQAAVLAWSARAEVPIVYAIEPGPNIAAARNRTLELAGGDWLAFLDDDEQAAPTWLAELVRAVEVYRADAAMGRVIAQYPDTAPAGLRLADPLSRHWGPSGRQLTTGSTANALLRAAPVRNGGRRFDERRGRTGGEDTDFFGRLAAEGIRIVAAPDAIVTEAVPHARMEATYLRRRALRAGHSYGEIHLRNLARPRRLLFLIASTTKAAGFMVLAASLGGFERPVAWRLRIRAWLNQGKLHACFGRPAPIMY